MSLPGKLCVGILEEDNPLRSYFRFKPLLIDDNGRYIPYADLQHYPQEGCIRIVPDKNESYHFKARMRQIGRFCVVDLRQHPGESDKIRPNKNFRPDGDEVNASIIYSDVVRAPAGDMIFEILPAEAARSPLPEPHTPAALLREGGALNPMKHTWAPLPDAEELGSLSATGETCPPEALQVFDLPGFREETVSFAIRPSEGLERVSDLPDRPAPALAPAKAEEAAPAPEAQPPQAPAAKADRPAPAPAEAGEKPWLHRDDSIAPPPVAAHLSRVEQLRSEQVGLNPRRSRSLQELIDEKWQRSRMNQLGQPVQPIATGAPVASPVETAVSAMREAWCQPALRDTLLQSLDALDDLGHLLDARREARRQSAVADELDSLEAQKLQLMGELDHLKAGTAEARRQLKQEIYREEAQALADAQRQTEAARAEQARWEQRAADARAAAEDAQALVDQLTGDQLEQKIRDVALTRRVMERLDHLKADAAASDVPAAAERIDLEGFIRRTQRRFAAHGWTLSRFDAANLCACFAISPALLLTGAPGSGKTTAARLLADALGLIGSDRVVTLAPNLYSACRNEERLSALKRAADLPAAVLLDDANLVPLSDPLRGLSLEPNPEWRVIATLQDAHSGHPVCAAVWDEGFAIRLTPPAGLPWQPASRHPVEAEPLASIAGVRETLPQADVPTRLVEKLERLRTTLAGAGAAFSRRALDDAWRYTAAMLAVLGDEADLDAVLDLAVAQRLLPGLLASAPIDAIVKLRPFLSDMPACAALFDQPLPMTI